MDMIREYYENGEDSGIVLNSEKECAVLEGRNWRTQLQSIAGSIVFIDEGNEFVSSKDLAAEIQKTDNYYVIVTRESLATLPYSVEEIYGIRNSGKYGSLRQTYNEFFHIYAQDRYQEKIIPKIVITEDSNSGFQFFDAVCKKNGMKCVSANGKSNVFKTILNQEEGPILVIADGAAFGSEMQIITELIKIRNDIVLYVPESFEWMILKADVIKDKEIEEILKTPYNYVDSENYFSWERFFTGLLIEKTQDFFLKYSKKNLNVVYTQDNIEEKILRVMEEIRFQ